MKKESFGSRGEGWVVAQVIVVAAALAIAYALRARDGWPGAWRMAGQALGLASAAIAAVFACGGVINLGRNLTVVPRPVEDGRLVQTGLYAVVRHPIYCGIIFGALAWALWLNSLAGLALALVVFLFFDLKSRREERWLAAQYPDYPGYRRRVRKLIPFVY